MLIEKMENRILVGIVSFVAIMVIVGWIAINETARMAAFERQFEGRSIERGAALFNANCSSCHGADGRGLVGIAPALNTPHLFGVDFISEIRVEMQDLQDDLEDLEEGSAEYAEIEARLAELQAEKDAFAATIQTAIDADYDIDAPDRLAQVGWAGGLEAYVLTTLVHGRPTSSSYWPQPMAAWSQTAGGPLRDDQLEYLTSYILNYDTDWTVDDLLAVQQHAKVPVDAALAAVSDMETVGTDVEAILVELENYTGDPNNGQTLYNGGVYACAGCHANAAIAPLTELTWPSAPERLADRPYDDPTQYIVESIVAPNEYIVAGYNANQMPQNFGDRMPYQDLADIIA